MKHTDTAGTEAGTQTDRADSAAAPAENAPAKNASAGSTSVGNAHADTVLAALVVRNLRKSYRGKAAVDGISLEVRKREIFGLIGANGAGKTTTIECALGVKTRDSGNVSVLGMDPVRDRKKLFARVGVQFQENRFQDRITVRESCETMAALYPRATRNPDSGDRPATRNWKPLPLRFGLAGKEQAAVQTLSGDELQKLAVVLVLIPNPKLLFLDELTTGLDPAARRGLSKSSSPSRPRKWQAANL